MKYIKKAERRKLIGFDDRKLIFISVPILGFFFPLLVFGISPLDGLRIFLIIYVVSILHISFYWFVLKLVIVPVRKKYLNIKDYKKRLIIQSVVALIITFLLSLLSENPSFCPKEMIMIINTPFFYKFIGSIVIVIIILSIYEGAYAFQLFKQGLIKNEELQRKNTQAQLAALQNQVNPHFLFNSLNTLASVIPEDSDTAVKFTENLANVYRYILEIRDKEIISLKEELNCITHYCYLLSIRFGNHVKFEFENLDDLEGKHIVPLSIQMLIENAIKHNIVSQSKPLTISLKMEDLEFVVCNNLQPKSKNVKSTGVGIENIKNRYKLLANKLIKIEKTENIFCVRLPILKMKELK